MAIYAQLIILREGTGKEHDKICKIHLFKGHKELHET